MRVLNKLNERSLAKGEQASLAYQPIAKDASPKKKRLAFVIAHLGHGGAQRVVANAANALVERGIDVHVIVMAEKEIAYELDPRIKLHTCFKADANPRSSSKSESCAGEDIAIEVSSPDAVALGSTRSLRKRITQWGPIDNYVRPIIVPVVLFVGKNARAYLRAAFFITGLMRRAQSLRRIIRNIGPDAVLSLLTQTNIFTIIATRGLNTRTVISERNDPRLQQHRPRVELMRRFVYRWADVVTANSRGALGALEGFVPQNKLAFLPNPLSRARTDEIIKFNNPTIIAVCRLVEQKGLDVLLAAWSRCVDLLPEWRLAILGDGPLRDELKEISKDLSIEDTVKWYGQVRDPLPFLRGAKFFISTSRFEGTPNALIEAMACGLPAVVSDASPGPCELVGPDESAGLIVPVESKEATAEAIVKLARDEHLRYRLGIVAKERALEYECDRAIDSWLQLLHGS